MASKKESVKETVAPTGWDVAETSNEDDLFEDVIKTHCPKCGKESGVRGLDWGDVISALDGVGSELATQLDSGELELPVIERMCANCSYRTKAAKKPMTAAQKDARKRYNQVRRERIKAALDLLAQQEQA
jgi:hypothetical protein